MLNACSGELVTLNTTAKELASWGVKVVVVLSTYMPYVASQNAELNLALRAVAFLDHVSARAVSLRYAARSAEFVRTLERP